MFDSWRAAAGGEPALSPTWISDALNIYSSEVFLKKNCFVKCWGGQRYEFPERFIRTGWRSGFRRGDTCTWDSVTPCSHFYGRRRRSRVTLNAPKLVPMRRSCGPELVLKEHSTGIKCGGSQIPHYSQVTNTFFRFHNTTLQRVFTIFRFDL